MEFDKKGRGTSLSQEQYDIIVSYMNTGRKPPLQLLKEAHLYGKLNGGSVTKNCSGYFRFKSIVNRLNLRQSDGALIFSGNGKVVLPNAKFGSVIMEAHQSPGFKHLNMSGTIAKLSETYTMGCRQFGISEETVRVVIKSCSEGNCAEKSHNRQGMGMMKDLVKTMKKQSKHTVNRDDESPSTKTPRKMKNGTLQVAALPISNTPKQKQNAQKEPAYAILEKLPNGNFVMKQIVVKNTSNTVGQTKNATEAFLANVGSEIAGNISDGATKIPTVSDINPALNNSGAVNTSILPDISKLLKSMGMIAVQNKSSVLPIDTGSTGSTFGSNGVVLPCLPSVQHNLVNMHNSSLSNNPSSNSTSSLQTDASSLMFAIPVNFIVTHPLLTNEKNRQQLGSIQNLKQLPKLTNMQEVLSAGMSTLPSSLPSSGLDISSSTASFENGNATCPNLSDQKKWLDNNNNTGMYLIESADEDSNDETNSALDDGSDSTDQCQPMDVCNEDQRNRLDMPFPFIWYSLKDLEKELDPYTRINLAIQDMRLDVHKSLRGDNMAMEKLKTKIDVIKEMVRAEKDRTEIYKDELLLY